GLRELEDWEAAFYLANASVYEEIATRVVLIGLPLLAIHAVRGRMAPLHRYVVGGGFRLDRPAVFLVAFSSWVFAYAHVVYGWDAWKLPPTLLGGAMFGYLFLRRGLHASILFHFMIDYLQMVDLLSYPAWYTDPLLVLGRILVLACIPLGLWLTYRYSHKALAHIRGRSRTGRAGGGPDGRVADHRSG
ncbi:MAG: CPBP family intramembrane metalloprotease, partial [Thermoplasmata archaeon]|nr:CPBP family intramembrane metalloprotease [Thermoplasmata archaeon]